MRQTSFQFFRNYKKSFGGSELVGRRKSRRPLSTKSPVHLILKSKTQKIFHPNNQSLRDLILRTAKKFNIQVHEYALNWSHIHLIIQLWDRQDYVRFIRALTSLMAMAFEKSRARNTLQKSSEKNTISGTEKLFTLRPFTRILAWGKDYKNTVQYVFLNFQESLGFKRNKRTTHRKKSRTEPNSFKGST